MNELFSTHYSHLEAQAFVVLILWIVPLFAYGIDFWTGVEAAKARGEELYSKGYRKTIAKITEYWRFQFMAFLIDVVGMFEPHYNLPYISMIATISIISVEFVSMRENLKKKAKDSDKTYASDAIDVAQGLVSQVINAHTKYDAEKLIERIKTDKNTNYNKQ
ncbi:MAG: phage holin family protein [Rikenellaceae bacterium]